MAKPVVGEIRDQSMSLEWNVTLPEKTSGCLISVLHCQSAENCSRTTIFNATEGLALLKIIPFARYDITVNTTCTFASDVIVFGVSETLNVLAATSEFPSPEK